MCGSSSGKTYVGRVSTHLRIKFALRNYIYHDQIDQNIKHDPWRVWKDLSDIANGWRKAIFEAIFPLVTAFPPDGKDSSGMKAVVTKDELFYLFGVKKRKRILIDYDSRVDDNLTGNLAANYLHVFPEKESKKNPAHVIGLFKLIACPYIYRPIKINKYASATTVQPPNLLPRNNKFYIIALPFLLTPQVFDYLKTLLQSQKYAKHYNVFKVSTHTNDLLNADPRNKNNDQSDPAITWTVPVFNIFHSALKIASAIRRCAEFTELQNPSTPLMPTDSYHRKYYGFRSKSQLNFMRNKTMYYSLLMSLCERDSSVKKLINYKLLVRCHEIHNRWLSMGARLFEVLAYMLESTFFVQLEESAITFEDEGKKNSQYWVNLFLSLAPILQSHDRGCAILSRRFAEIGQKKQTSPLSIYSEAVFSAASSSKAAKAKAALWSIETYSGKTVDSLSALFNGYVYFKITNFTGLKKDDLALINKDLDKAAETFKKNLPSGIKGVGEVGKALLKSLSLAKKLSDIAEGKIGLGNVTDTLNFIADHYSKYDKTAYSRLYGRAVIFKFASTLLSAIDEGYNAYKLYSRADYDALIGSGMVVAAGATELIWLCATKSLLSGPVGWIVGGVALVGGVIVMAASDSDFETFAHRCFFAKKQEDKNLDNLFVGDFYNWGTLIPSGVQNQLHSLLNVFYKIEDAKYERVGINNLLVKAYFNCRPEGASAIAYLEFDGPGSQTPWLKLYASRIGKKWPRLSHKRSTGAPVMYRDRHRLEPDKKKGKWKLELIYDVTNWNYLGDEFENGWIKVYPFGMKTFDCPPHKKARRINAPFYGSDYTEI